MDNRVIEPEMIELAMAVYRHNGLLNERLLPEDLRGYIEAAERVGFIEAQERDDEGWRVLRLTEAGRRMVDGKEVG